jgi:ElaB/YqjD/DUF883 family membrane-anchored ribosome-binding protein
MPRVNQRDVIGMDTGAEDSGFSEGMSSGMKELRSQGANVKEEIKNVGHEIRQFASTAGQVARTRLDPVQKYIRERPLSAVFIAAGVGVILGMLRRWR